MDVGESGTGKSLLPGTLSTNGRIGNPAGDDDEQWRMEDECDQPVERMATAWCCRNVRLGLVAGDLDDSGCSDDSGCRRGTDHDNR